MITLKDDDGNELPKEIRDKVNAFIERLPNVPWFKPSPVLNKDEVEKQAKFTLECFGVKAEVEYRSLNTQGDWDSARDSAWASAWASAKISAWASAKTSAWASARDSAWASARASARASDRASDRASTRDSDWTPAWASAEILVSDDAEFHKKYPNGAFVQLFKLWEMGLYPVGVFKETGTFVIYVPPCEMKFPF